MQESQYTASIKYEMKVMAYVSLAILTVLGILFLFIYTLTKDSNLSTTLVRDGVFSYAALLLGFLSFGQAGKRYKGIDYYQLHFRLLPLFFLLLGFLGVWVGIVLFSNTFF